jgi:hypothetical protein
MVIAISPYISFYFLMTVAPKISVSKDRHKRPGGGPNDGALASGILYS